ncbi:unnamed protein product [Rhodiola kirilowii]
MKVFIKTLKGTTHFFFLIHKWTKATETAKKQSHEAGNTTETTKNHNSKPQPLKTQARKQNTLENDNDTPAPKARLAKNHQTQLRERGNTYQPATTGNSEKNAKQGSTPNQTLH